VKIAFVYMNNVGNVGRGAGYVYASILRNEYEVEFFDTAYVGIRELSVEVMTGGFDLLAISSTSLFFPAVLELVKRVKKEIRGIKVLLGGIHATILGGEILRENPLIDFVCVGEGESFIGDFLNNWKDENWESVKNLCYRRDGRVMCNRMREAEDLAELPEFPWGVFRRVVNEKGWIYVNATRGCPFRCAYCCNGVYLEKYGRGYLRQRPVESVIEEMKFLKEKYAPRLFYFGDEMIFTNKEYAVELFERIKKEIAVPYGFMTRVEYLDEEMMGVLKRTGCEYVAMGVECGNEEYRTKRLKRHCTNEQIVRAFQLCKREGIETCSFNMIGWPTERDDELCWDTIKLNERAEPGEEQWTWFYPFPGTEMYRECMEKGMIDGKVNTVSYHDGSVLTIHRDKPRNPKEYLKRLKNERKEIVDEKGVYTGECRYEGVREGETVVF